MCGRRRLNRSFSSSLAALLGGLESRDNTIFVVGPARDQSQELEGSEPGTGYRVRAKSWRDRRRGEDQSHREGLRDQELPGRATG